MKITALEKKFPKRSLPCSQESATNPYTMPDESNSELPQQNLKVLHCKYFLT